MKNIGLLLFTLLIFSSLMLTSCGGGESPPTDDVAPPPVEEESAEDETEMQTNTTGMEFEDQELPANFPEVFPLPEYAKIGSAVDMPGENNYRIFFAFPEVTLEEALAYYNLELPEKGWSVDAEGPEALGYGMWITHPEYESKLDFIVDEYGVVLDLALAPLGELVMIPEGAEIFGGSEGLGESVGDFPADFPVPASFTAIDLPAKLADEGYQLAFNFSNMAELAIIDLSTAMMAGGWVIGSYEPDLTGSFYVVPFTGPNEFQGYALITAKPDVAGLSSISGSVIALHTGVWE